jgi:ribonuclease Z
VQGATTSRRATLAVLMTIACVSGGCIEQRLRAEFTRADRAMLKAPGMTLALCGTGTGLADARRAGPCTAVVAAGRLFLVDVGPGAWESADLGRLPITALDTVLLTKLLADDVADLGEAITRSWLAGREHPLAVYGPRGTTRLVTDVVDALHFDVAMRLGPHTAAVLRPELASADAYDLALAADDDVVTVLDEDGLRITAFGVGSIGGLVKVGYRFDYRGRSIVVSGHGRKHPNVVRFAAGADVLVHEAASHEMIERGVGVLETIGYGRAASFARESLVSHATPIEAAEVARAAGVGLLVLTQLYPSPNTPLTRWKFMQGVRDVFASTRLGEDGFRVYLAPRPGPPNGSGAP